MAMNEAFDKCDLNTRKLNRVLRKLHSEASASGDRATKKVCATLAALLNDAITADEILTVCLLLLGEVYRIRCVDRVTKESV